MEYLLDTDICIALLKGKFHINKKIEYVGIDNCAISEITIAELTYGARNSDDYNKHIQEVKKIQELFKTIPIAEVFDEFAKQKVQLRKKGILIPDFDLLIGTTSIVRKMKMVTNNEKHLRRLADIEIENWMSTKFNEFL